MQDNSNTVEKQPVPKKPKGFDDNEDFLTDARRNYSDDVGADKTNREEDLIDHKFASGRQWDEIVYQQRINAHRPALTINRLVAFIAQVIGNRRLNETVIKIVPDHGGSKEGAKVREGLVRHIQKTSAAKRAYDAAFQSQVIGGLGNFKVDVDYVSDDVFDQEIRITPIYDSQAVVWDKNSQDPTGADARHVFVTEQIPKAQFKKMFPQAEQVDFASDEPNYQQLYSDGWYDKGTVRVAEYWRVLSKKRTLALFQDGATRDVTDEDPAAYLPLLQVRANGAPIMREARVKYAEMYLISGAEILEGPYEQPIKRVPVFRVPGWEINTGTYKTRFGLVRWLRDPSRIHNYMESIKIEKLMLSPKAKWLVGKTAGQGYENSFRNAHKSEDSVLFWNDEASTKPEYVKPADLEAAIIQASQDSVQMLKDVSNLHEASFGQTSNEVSGKAITARQRVGEMGTVIYQDNLNMAIEEAGRVINDLIPFVYDAPRVIKILGDDTDSQPEFVRVNYPGDPRSVDLTYGKYDVSVTTGPSYATKRIEAAESMMAAVNAMPETFAVAGDLIAEAQDWPGADKIAKRLRTQMPPDLVGDDLTDEQRAQLEAQAQKQQQMEALAERAQVAEIALKEAQAADTMARAESTRAKIDRDDVDVEAKIDKIYAEIKKLTAETGSIETRDQLETIDALTGENNVSGNRD